MTDIIMTLVDLKKINPYSIMLFYIMIRFQSEQLFYYLQGNSVSILNDTCDAYRCAMNKIENITYLFHKCITLTPIFRLYTYLCAFISTITVVMLFCECNVHQSRAQSTASSFQILLLLLPSSSNMNYRVEMYDVHVHMSTQTLC